MIDEISNSLNLIMLKLWREVIHLCERTYLKMEPGDGGDARKTTAPETTVAPSVLGTDRMLNFNPEPNFLSNPNSNSISLRNKPGVEANVMLKCHS